MALTESNMMDLGTCAPDFNLFDTRTATRLTYADCKGKNGTVVMFICNHCPYVVHVNEELVRIARDYNAKEIGFVAINSNDTVKYPDDNPEKMKWVANLLKYPFPYLFDEDQAVAHAYQAACTPDIYLFDADDCLVYRGRLDGSRPGNDIPLTGKDLRLALDVLLHGEPPLTRQYPSAGCNIKWK